MHPIEFVLLPPGMSSFNSPFPHYVSTPQKSKDRFYHFPSSSTQSTRSWAETLLQIHPVTRYHHYSTPNQKHLSIASLNWLPNCCFWCCYCSSSVYCPHDNSHCGIFVFLCRIPPSFSFNLAWKSQLTVAKSSMSALISAYLPNLSKIIDCLLCAMHCYT